MFSVLRKMEYGCQWNRFFHVHNHVILPQERAQRIQSEAAIETLRRLEEKRPHAPLVLQSMAHSEEAAAAVEDEKRNLKLKINELKITCEEKEAQRVAEVELLEVNIQNLCDNKVTPYR